MIYTNLNPDKALIWRIVHRDNLPWILEHGLHCANSKLKAVKYVNIGNIALIDKRNHRDVPIEPFGKLSDYVPFYFTPFSVMMKNIQSGRGVQQRNNEDIVILVSSLPHLQNLGLRFVFTNAHAYPSWTEYFDQLNDLTKIDWKILQHRDFKRDEDDPQKMERYQAEALIYSFVPVEGILGMICYTDEVRLSIEEELQKRKLTLPIHTRKEWYFT